jgi:hypothetical protein
MFDFLQIRKKRRNRDIRARFTCQTAPDVV